MLNEATIEEEIVALTAKLEKYTKKNTQSNKKHEGKTENKDKTGDSTMKKWVPPKKIDPNDLKQAWKFIQPQQGQVEITKNGNTYKWCTFHKMWATHDELTCKAKKWVDKKKTTDAPDKGTSEYSQALKMIQEEELT